MLREKIRRITDGLKDDAWIRFLAIYDRLPSPKPPKPYLSVELTTMHRAGMLKRRGRKHLYEYRSGRKPAIDRRALRKGKPQPHKSSLIGFAELARIEREDPTRYQKLVAEEQRRARA